MFGRLLWKLLRGNRGRLTVALVAVISGAAVISALLNLEFDISRKLTQEFRLLGPNIVISAKGGAQSGVGATPPALIDEGAVKSAVEQTAKRSQGGPGITPYPYVAVPYLYVVAQLNGTPVVLTGTKLDLAEYQNPTWKAIASEYDPSMPGDWSFVAGSCIVGRNVARDLGLTLRESVVLRYRERKITLTVGQIIDTGAAEDSQILADLAAVQDLTGTTGKIEIEQILVSGSKSTIAAHAAALRAAMPEYDVRPIRQVSEAEGNLLNRTRLLIVSMILLILALTALCVLATMAALAMERRADVGLMKALGGTISRIVGLFLAEVGVLGAAGGLIGCVAGMALAQWMGRRVFGTSITPRWEVFPMTIAMMVAVALAGALPLRRLGKVKPAVILRGE